MCLHKLCIKIKVVPQCLWVVRVRAVRVHRLWARIRRVYGTMCSCLSARRSRIRIDITSSGKYMNRYFTTLIFNKYLIHVSLSLRAHSYQMLIEILQWRLCSAPVICSGVSYKDSVTLWHLTKSVTSIFFFNSVIRKD